MVHASAGKKKSGKGNEDEDSAQPSEGFSVKSGKGHAKDLPCQKAGKLKPGKLGNEEEDRVKEYVKQKLERRGLCLYRCHPAMHFFQVLQGSESYCTSA